MTSRDLSSDSSLPDRATPRPGSLARRLLARLVDGVIVLAAGSLSFVAVYSPAALERYLTTGVFTGVLLFVYFVAFEASLGWTPGKKILGLAVRGTDRMTKPTVGESAVRNGFTLLQIIPLVGGFLAFAAIVAIGVTIGGSRSKRGIHDDMAHTFVVRP